MGNNYKLYFAFGINWRNFNLFFNMFNIMLKHIFNMFTWI